MSNNLTALVHSTALKDFAKTLLAAMKQLTDEGAAVLASGEPVAAPIIAIAEPLADSFFEAAIARVTHLETDETAKAEAVAAVAEPTA